MSYALSTAIAIATSPITLVIAAVAAAGLALWAFFTKTETGRKLWEKIWPAITNAVRVAWDWIKNTFATAWSAISPVLSQIGTVAKEAFGKFVEATKTVWTAIQPAIAWVGRLWLAIAKLQFGVAIGALKALGG